MHRASASPIRLIDITVMKISAPGKIINSGALRKILAAVAEDIAPFRLWRLYA